ncbi:flavoprotein [Pseudonocardia sp.]|uniref:flavoprotein n=1 Tax=Pseudonocardia sp. TaxID=60912 RepID=UPI0031FD7EC1
METVRADFVEPALTRPWLGRGDHPQPHCFPVRDQVRRPGGSRPHPPLDCYLVAPATANTVAKLTLGIADYQTLTTAGNSCPARTCGRSPSRQ